VSLPSRRATPLVRHTSRKEVDSQGYLVDILVEDSDRTASCVDEERKRRAGDNNVNSMIMNIEA
jgi:hypothetical protein